MIFYRIKEDGHYKKKFYRPSVIWVLIIIAIIITNIFCISFRGEKKRIRKDPNLLKYIFYREYIGNDELCDCIIYYADINNVDIDLFIALIGVESKYDKNAVNINYNSKDIGYCQLNTNVYKEYDIYDLYNMNLNIRLGAEQLKWCIDRAEGNIIKALAYYNTGFGKVERNNTPKQTLDYINKVLMLSDEIKLLKNDYINKE